MVTRAIPINDLTSPRTIGSMTIPLSEAQRTSATTDAVTIGLRPEGFVVARAEGLSGVRARDAISLIPDHAVAHFFDSATGLRLSGVQ